MGITNAPGIRITKAVLRPSLGEPDFGAVEELFELRAAVNVIKLEGEAQILSTGTFVASEGIGFGMVGTRSYTYPWTISVDVGLPKSEES